MILYSLSMTKSSPLIDRQIEGDASENVFSVFEISEEADRDVETGHDHHRSVQHAVPTHQRSRSSHLKETCCCRCYCYGCYLLFDVIVVDFVVGIIAQM